MKKITRATFKSFLKNNRNNLFIKIKSTFDGMTDSIQPANHAFSPVKYILMNDYNLGIQGVWLVGTSRDYFEYYNDGEFEGIRVSNSCGKFIITRKIEG